MEPREALCTQQSCDQDLRQRGGQEQGSRSAGRPLPGDALPLPEWRQISPCDGQYGTW